MRKYELTSFAVNYIDDILIFSKPFSEHINHLSKLLEAIVREGFRLKITECTFAESSVKYLGHMIEENTIKPVKDNLVLVRNFPVPKKKKKKSGVPGVSGDKRSSQVLAILAYE